MVRCIFYIYFYQWKFGVVTTKSKEDIEEVFQFQFFYFFVFAIIIDIFFCIFIIHININLNLVLCGAVLLHYFFFNLTWEMALYTYVITRYHPWEITIHSSPPNQSTFTLIHADSNDTSLLVFYVGEALNHCDWGLFKVSLQSLLMNGFWDDNLYYMLLSCVCVCVINMGSIKFWRKHISSNWISP